jgi:hypothetical protein
MVTLTRDTTLHVVNLYECIALYNLCKSCLHISLILRADSIGQTTDLSALDLHVRLRINWYCGSHAVDKLCMIQLMNQNITVPV